MDAIKKKMQAMKLEKDNAMDRADACEQQAKDANLRAEKAEEEVRDLQKKMQQLESDLDVTQEKLLNATQKLDQASTAADDNQRMCKVLENKSLSDESRMEALENQLKEARMLAEEADKKYDECAKKLATVEGDPDRAEERA